MSSKNRDHGGPAFPVVAENGLGHVSTGMSLRDYFAAKALQGILSHPSSTSVYTWGGVAESAYKIADTMLADRTTRE